MIAEFCKTRLPQILPAIDAEKLQLYLLNLISRRCHPPTDKRGMIWSEIATDAGIDLHLLFTHREAIRPALSAIIRSLRDDGAVVTLAGHCPPQTRSLVKRGPKPKAIEEFPTAISDHWEEPETFSEALSLHARRHGESYWHLFRAVTKPDERQDFSTLRSWMNGAKFPRSLRSFEILKRIERRYRLPDGYFKSKLPHRTRAATGHVLRDIGVAERRRLAWHLPDDFNQRPDDEQEIIVQWVRSVIISGTTDYRRFQAAAAKQRFALRFPGVSASLGSRIDQLNVHDEPDCQSTTDVDDEVHRGVANAPPLLASEMASLIRFKTSTLSTLGLQRNGVWGEETAAQKIEHFGLMFGALAAVTNSPIKGHGVSLRHLTFALLVFPSVWDWYLQWRESRRGFYTSWEVDMLRVGLALTRQETGWLRQSGHLAKRLRPIAGLASLDDIGRARSDWSATCDAFFKYATGRARELQRIVRVHRDPFEPIMPVLEAQSPVGEYRKITEEILRTMPDSRRYPRATAEAVRSFLMLRLGLHLGLRQKNLRQLMLCPRGTPQRTEKHLTDIKRGELRWSDRDGGWEVLIPAVAFKNSTSSYFGNKPFRLVLPNKGDLYAHLEAYIDSHRAALLAGATDPGTLFVKTVKVTTADAAYCQNTFYEAWRLTIQRYGIYNPFTGRGAIKGLLPHGPHNVRDVLATHILKQTGSYEQASYAIQDTPDMVAKHYGRFLPQDKAALAAKILNQAWEDT